MTLQRILEPEVMDSPREATEYNDMDHSIVNQQFVGDLKAHLGTIPDIAKVLSIEDPETADDELLEKVFDVLDVGTGTALIPVELCEQSKGEFRVMAIDMAVSMLDLAVYNIEASGLTQAIQLAQVDAKSMEFDDGLFDIVMSNSIVHHIAEPLACLEQMVRVTRAGGALFVRDLMRPADLATLEQWVTTYAGQETEYSQKLFRDSLHASLSLEEMRQFVQQLGFDGEKVTATSDRHWTWAAVKPALETPPESA